MKVLLLGHGFRQIPFGLADIHQYLLQKGFDSEIVHLRVRGLDTIDYTPDYVGITSMTPVFYDTLEIAKEVKQKWPDCKVVLGGKHFARGTISLDDEWTEGVDHIVTDDGEYALEGILNGEITDKIVYGDSLSRDDYRALPFPGTEALTSYLKYAKSKHQFEVLFSRGCPYKCVFCESNSFRKKVISKDPVEAAQYIAMLEKWAPRKKEVFIGDDVFTTNKRWLIAFAEEWNRLNIKMSPRCFIHAKLFNEELLEILLSINVGKLSLGAESGDDGVLKAVKKMTTVEDYLKVDALVKSKAPKVPFQCLWMFGNITDTNTTMAKTIELSKKIGTSKPWFSCAIPFPGTEFWRVADQYGTIIQKDFSKWGNTEIVFLPNGVSKEDMIRFSNEGESVKYEFRHSSKK